MTNYKKKSLLTMENRAKTKIPQEKETITTTLNSIESSIEETDEVFYSLRKKLEPLISQKEDETEEESITQSNLHGELMRRILFLHSRIVNLKKNIINLEDQCEI